MNSRISLFASAVFCAAVIAVASFSIPAAEIRIDGKTFKLPDGFTIERVAGPPMVDRPIVGSFDEQGRLYIADSSGSGEKVQKQLETKPHRVVRLEAANPLGEFQKSSVFADRLMFPEGTLWYAGSLYVGAPPSIWKLTDVNGTGVATQRSEWFQGKTLTGCANDIHGPYLGPDGWIYWCKGAFAEQTYERPGHKPFVTKAAHIFRCQPDGSGIEPVMTGGMDNPVHVVFTPGGERLFTTTFLVNPAGGQRDGIIHAVYGGLYGKVHDDVLDDQPHTSPDLMPVLVHLGPAACCGLARYESDAFGPEYQNNLFATCFNLHKVTRHVLSPEGATFKSNSEDFLTCESVDFHPTDVLEDADGSLLMLDTGGWYKICCPTSQFSKPDVLGAIYRVRKIDARPINDPRGLKLDWEKLGVDELARLLDDPRPAVQTRAIEVVAKHGAAAIAALKGSFSKAHPAGRLNAIWAATRIEGAEARAFVRRALDDPDAVVRQAATHSISLLRDKEAEPTLIALLSSESRANRRVAAEALGRIGGGRAVAAILAHLADDNDHVLDHSLTYALIEIGDAAATSLGLSSSNPRVRRAAMMALDQMEKRTLAPQAVTADLNASDAALRETAAWIAVRHPEWGNVLVSALEKRMAQAGPAAADPQRLQHQLARLAKSPSIQAMLATRATSESAPMEERRLALAAMGESRLRPVPETWLTALNAILSADQPALAPDAVKTLRELSLNPRQAAAIVEPMLRIAGQENLAPDVRLNALAAVPGNAIAVTPEIFNFLLGQLKPDQATAQRLIASQIIARAKLTSDQLIALADVLKSAGPLEIDHLLSAFSQSREDAVGLKLIASLRQRKSINALRADSLKSNLRNYGPQVQKELEPLLVALNPDAGQQKAKLEELLATLPPGDVRRGQGIFNSAKVSCSSCHAIGYVGGNVGPDLTRVGAIRTERDLLESIVFPSASFVQSFEPMLVDTRDGDRQSGILRKNDADEVVLITGPNQELHIPRANVKDIRPGTVSVMPSGLDQQLSKQELADLVAFLQACK